MKSLSKKQKRVLCQLAVMGVLVSGKDFNVDKEVLKVINKYIRK